MSDLRVGFTGTREGLSTKQRAALYAWIDTLDPFVPIEFHQGCCLGADATATDIVDRKLGLAVIHGHPSNLKGWTSENAIRLSKVLHPAKPPLTRNKDIIEACNELHAYVMGPESEFYKSGTWMTIRHARKMGKKITIVWRDGTLTQEG